MQVRTRGVPGGGAPKGALPPPPQTYTDRTKLKQLRRALVWLKLLGLACLADLGPTPSENHGHAPGDYGAMTKVKGEIEVKIPVL